MSLACCRSPSVGIFLSPYFAELVGDARRFSFNDSLNALGHIAALDAFLESFSLPVRALAALRWRCCRTFRAPLSSGAGKIP